MAKVHMLGRMKDGGTQCIHYKSIEYWIDFRKNTATPGSIYDAYPDEGKKVHKALSAEIYQAIQKEIIENSKETLDRKYRNIKFGSFG